MNAMTDRGSDDALFNQLRAAYSAFLAEPLEPFTHGKEKTMNTSFGAEFLSSFQAPFVGSFSIVTPGLTTGGDISLTPRERALAGADIDLRTLYLYL